MLNGLLALFAFLLAMVPLVVVHEWGHYWVARRLGVKILRFSIGFGKPVWSRRFGADQTEWAVAAIPLGGYVKMVDESEGSVAPEDLPRAFNRQPLWKRALIVLAGPMANLLFAFVLFAAMLMYGVTQVRPEVMDVRGQSMAAAAGFRSGDRLQAINAERVVSWGDVDMHLLLAALGQRDVFVDVIGNDGSERRLRLDFAGYDRRHLDPRLASDIGFRRLPQSSEARVGGLADDGAAARAGLRKGDLITAINGKPLANWDAMVAIIEVSAERPLDVQVQREGRRFNVRLKPARVVDGARIVGRIGVAPVFDWPRADAMVYTLRLGLLDAAAYSWDKGAAATRLTLEMLGRMALGQVSLKNVSGPIGIADMAGQTIQAGMPIFLSFLVLMSLSLGIMNLLPIPVLDGGHLMYYVAEAIRGRPLSERTLLMGQRLGLVFLGLLTLLAVYNDLHRLILSH